MPWIAKQGRLYIVSGNKGTPVLNWSRDPNKAHRFSTKEAALNARAGVEAIEVPSADGTCVNCRKGIHRLCEPSCSCDCEQDSVWAAARKKAGKPVKPSAPEAGLSKGERDQCADSRCRKHYGNGAEGQGDRPVRIGWYHGYTEPHHVPGCRHYASASNWGGIAFRTRADAEMAGHPPAKCCAAIAEERRT